MSEFSKYYTQLCIAKLSECFSFGIHNNPEDVYKAFKICQNSLITEYENELKKINTTAIVDWFLENYINLCETLENTTNLTDREIMSIIINKLTCKNVFLQITQNTITSSEKTSFTQEVMDKLYYLTYSLSKLAQDQQFFYLYDKKHYQLELYEDCYAFTLSDESYIKYPSFNWNENIGSISKIKQMQQFREQTINAFGYVAEELYNIVFHPSIIDLNSISEQDFMQILKGNYNSNIQRHGIINITFLFFKYPNNPFLNGLTLRRENTSLSRTIKNPNYPHGIRFRPIIELHIDDNICYVTTSQLVFEALDEHISNLIPFNILPEEWEGNESIKNFGKDWKNQHDKWLDDEVENIINKSGYYLLRNITGIDGINIVKTPSVIPNKNVGEIDFIIIDETKRTVYVVDTKYIKVKKQHACISDDKSKFMGGKKTYNEQLLIKYEWIRNNLFHVQNEFIRKGVNINITDYDVDLFFITNAPSFYSIISEYPIIPVKELLQYLESHR